MTPNLITEKTLFKNTLLESSFNEYDSNPDVLILEKESFLIICYLDDNSFSLQFMIYISTPTPSEFEDHAVTIELENHPYLKETCSLGFLNFRLEKAFDIAKA